MLRNVDIILCEESCAVVMLYYLLCICVIAYVCVGVLIVYCYLLLCVFLWEESGILLGGGSRILSTSGGPSGAKPREAACPEERCAQKSQAQDSRETGPTVFEIPPTSGETESRPLPRRGRGKKRSCLQKGRSSPASWIATRRNCSQTLAL